MQKNKPFKYLEDKSYSDKNIGEVLFEYINKKIIND